MDHIADTWTFGHERVRRSPRSSSLALSPPGDMKASRCNVESHSPHWSSLRRVPNSSPAFMTLDYLGLTVGLTVGLDVGLGLDVGEGEGVGATERTCTGGMDCAGVQTSVQARCTPGVLAERAHPPPPLIESFESHGHQMGQMETLEILAPLEILEPIVCRSFQHVAHSPI